MLTRKRWTAPNYTGNPATDYANLTKSISDYLLSLEAKGSLTIGEAEINANQGIKFPATQVASSDANTLDDYEEGTWTPGISFGGGATGIAYTTQTGSYTKIGNRVRCTGTIVLSAKGSSTGAAKITGLPFSVRNNNDSIGTCALYMAVVTFTGQFQGLADGGATTVAINQTTEAGTASNLSDTNFSNTSQVRIDIEYQVA